jgi:hypothetical protein
MLRGKLTYANVMATIAVFIALGGSAYAATQLKKNSVGAKQLKKNAVSGAKVKDGSLSAADIGGAVDSADHASTADRADSAVRATNAETSIDALRAANAERLGGSPSSAFVQTGQLGGFLPAQGHFEHSDFGCPFDLTSWHNNNPTVNETTGYWRDPFGVVHLRGFAIRCGTAETTIFTLPPGYRPEKREHFIAFMENSAPETGLVTVEAKGAIVASEVTSNNSIALDGITFKCAPSGSNGCP